MTVPVTQVTDDFKIAIFRQLVSAVNKIEGIKIELESKETNCYRDALAFLVEEMTRMYTPEQSKLLLEELIKKISSLVEDSRKPNEARWYLHTQISTLYQAKIAQKIAKKENGWEQVNLIYSWIMERNAKAYQENRPVEFGGINYSVLPHWYQKRYLGITTRALDSAASPSLLTRAGHWIKRLFD